MQGLVNMKANHTNNEKDKKPVNSAFHSCAPYFCGLKRG